MRRADVGAWVDNGFAAQTVEVDLWQFAHQVAGIGLHQHGHGLAVGQGVGDALQRVGRVDRHVARASLEDAQQADDHLRAALHADRHAVIRANALGQQAVGDLVGAFVELTVGHALVIEAQCNGIRLGGGVGFDLLMDQGGVGVVRGAFVEAVQEGVTFGVRQDIQAAERHVRSLFKRLGQAFQGGVQVGGDTFGTDGCVDHYR